MQGLCTKTQKSLKDLITNLQYTYLEEQE